MINGNALDVCTHHAGIGRTGFVLWDVLLTEKDVFASKEWLRIVWEW